MKKITEIAIRKAGGKVHSSVLGSSTCDCGYWLKRQTSIYRIKGEIKKETLCEKCFPNRQVHPDLQFEMEIKIK